MADKRAYFKLDVGYLTNPKIAAVATERPTAVILHIGSIGYAAQHLTDGIVPVALLLRLTGLEQADADLLVSAGLWTALDGGNAEVHDFREHQRSADAVKRAEEAGRVGAKARWDAVRNADRNADGNATTQWVPPMPREREREKESTSSAALPDFDAWWATYPRKENKGAAIKAYRAARKSIDAAQLLDLTGKWFADRPDLERKFTPLPTSWLNGQRWADERPAAAPSLARSPWDRPAAGGAR